MDLIYLALIVTCSALALLLVSACRRLEAKK